MDIKDKNYINNIRSQYKKDADLTKIEQLRNLDKKVKLPIIVISYIFGIIGSLILGTGMCFTMKVIETDLDYAMTLGIGIGVLGIIIVAINYPLYKALLKIRKKKYAEQILSLSDELLHE